MSFGGITQSHWLCSRADSQLPFHQVKCITDDGEPKCRRCLKYHEDCRFEEHKRGRRKGKV